MQDEGGFSIFDADSDKGTFTIEAKAYKYGPYFLDINGLKALQEGHQFQSADSLVVISSVRGLDVISVFKEAAQQPRMLIRIVNPTDSALEIRSVKMFCPPDTGAEEKQAFEVTGQPDPLWQWLNDDTVQASSCSLMLSASSIVLLPGEGIVLPPLHFFSHLCSE